MDSGNISLYRWNMDNERYKTIIVDEMNDTDNPNPPPFFFGAESFVGDTISSFCVFTDNATAIKLYIYSMFVYIGNMLSVLPVCTCLLSIVDTVLYGRIRLSGDKNLITAMTSPRNRKWDKVFWSLFFIQHRQVNI